MAPNAANETIRGRLEEICGTLRHLKHEQATAHLTMLSLSKHMVQVDNLIDEHQCKMNELMKDLTDQSTPPPPPRMIGPFSHDWSNAATPTDGQPISNAVPPLTARPANLVDMQPKASKSVSDFIDETLEIAVTGVKSKKRKRTAVGERAKSATPPVATSSVQKNTASSQPSPSSNNNTSRGTSSTTMAPMAVPLVSCQHCATQFATDVQFESHMAAKHPQTAPSSKRPCYRCLVCDAAFISNNYLFRHLALNNCKRELANVEVPASVPTSTNATSTSTSYPPLPPLHMPVPPTHQSYKCPTCKQTFQYLWGLQLHISSGSCSSLGTSSNNGTCGGDNSASPSYQCIYCSEMFTHGHKLDFHVKAFHPDTAVPLAVPTNRDRVIQHELERLGGTGSSLMQQAEHPMNSIRAFVNSVGLDASTRPRQGTTDNDRTLTRTSSMDDTPHSTAGVRVAIVKQEVDD